MESFTSFTKLSFGYDFSVIPLEYLIVIDTFISDTFEIADFLFEYVAIHPEFGITLVVCIHFAKLV